MKKIILLFIAAFSVTVSSAQITSAISPQIGPAIVNGKVFIIGGGDYSIGGDYLRIGLGAMFSLTDPKVKIMGTGPYRHKLTYAGISAEYTFDLADVINVVSEEYEMKAVILGGIGESGLDYVGTTGTPTYSGAFYYILQPSIFYTFADAGVPMQVGLSFRYIQSPQPYTLKPRHFTGINITYRVTIDYDTVFGI